MGGSGISITVTGDGDRAALHDFIWETVEVALARFDAKYWTGDSGEYIGEMILEERDAGRWGPDGDTLRFSFRDYAGCCSTSAALWTHWTMLVLAQRWDHLRAQSDLRGLTLLGRPPAVDELMADPLNRFLRFRQNWWSVEEAGLGGDDTFVPVADLTPAQRAKHAEALRDCLCGPCRAVRRRIARRRSG